MYPIPLSAAVVSASTARIINFSVVFAGQLVGACEVADRVWQVTFLENDLGFFDKEGPGRTRPQLFVADSVLTRNPE
ncbi:MAG TPA: hypothetical protein VFZ51_08960 [Woeseiaceae bacterium]